MSRADEDIFVFAGHSYDVELARDLVTEDDLEMLNLEDIAGTFWAIRIDKERAESLPDHVLDEPGIAALIDVNNDTYLIPIDGWHRAWARYQRGYEEMPFYVIDDWERSEQLILK